MIKKTLYILICAILLSTLAFAAPQDMNREMNSSMPAAQRQEHTEEINFDESQASRPTAPRGENQQMPDFQMPEGQPVPNAQMTDFQMPESQVTETAETEPKPNDTQATDAEDDETKTTGEVKPDVNASATQIPNIPTSDSMPNFQMPEDGSRPSREGMPEGGFQMGGFPGDRVGMQFGTSGNYTQTPKTFKDIILEYLTPILSMVFLGLGFVFVFFYKKKKY